MNPNLKPSQRSAILGALGPISASSVQSTGWVDASKFQNFLAIIKVGVMQASATVDAKIQQAQDSSGTGVKDITGKAITQLLHSTPDDNKQCLINVRQDDLDVNGGFGFIRLSITPATAASLIDGSLLGVDPRYGPADLSAATSQAQVVG